MDQSWWWGAIPVVQFGNVSFGMCPPEGWVAAPNFPLFALLPCTGTQWVLEAVSEIRTWFVTFLSQDLEVYMMWFERQL